jgi:hypothetical protein
MSSSTDELWQYAKEALLLALSAESDDDRQSLMDLAQTWTRAAIVERRSPVGHDDKAIAA